MKSKKDFNVGDKVFAKVKGYPPWPATIDEIKGKKYSVTFYGTKETSKLKIEDLCDYLENRDKITVKYSKKKGFLDSVRELEEELSGNNTTIREGVYKEDERLNQDDESEQNNDDTDIAAEEIPSSATTQKRNKRSLSSQSGDDLPKAKRPAVSRKSSIASNASDRNKYDSPEHNNQFPFESPLEGDDDDNAKRDAASPTPEMNTVNSTVNGRDYEIVFADELYEKTKDILEQMEAATAAGKFPLTHIIPEKIEKSRRSLIFKSYKYYKPNDIEFLNGTRNSSPEIKEVSSMVGNNSDASLRVQYDTYLFPNFNDLHYQALSTNIKNSDYVSIDTQMNKMKQNFTCDSSKKCVDLKHTYGIDNIIQTNQKNSTPKIPDHKNIKTNNTQSKQSHPKDHFEYALVPKKSKSIRINPSAHPRVPSTLSRCANNEQNLKLLNPRKKVNKKTKSAPPGPPGARRFSQRLMSRRQNSDVAALMKYLTSPEADRSLRPRRTNYLVYTVQCEFNDACPCPKRPKYDLVDDTQVLDDSDYGVSDDSDEELVKTMEFSTFIKYYQAESPFQQSEYNFSYTELVKIYENLHEAEVAEDSNRCIRVSELRKRKISEDDIIIVTPNATKPSNPIPYEKLMSLRESELVSFLTFCNQCNQLKRHKRESESESESCSGHAQKKRNIKLQLTSLVDSLAIANVNLQNWKSDDLHWLIENINPEKMDVKFQLFHAHISRSAKQFTSPKDERPNSETKIATNGSDKQPKNSNGRKSRSRKRRIQFTKQEVPKQESPHDLDQPSTSYANYREKNYHYGTDSDSSDCENYIKTLNEQVKRKRLETNMLREKPSPKSENSYNEITRKIMVMSLELTELSRNEEDFIGYPTIEKITETLRNCKNQSFLDARMQLSVAMTQNGDVEMMAYQEYCQNPKKSKLKSYRCAFGRNDIGFSSSCAVKRDMETGEFVTEEEIFNVEDATRKSSQNPKFEIFMDDEVNQDPPATADDDLFKQKNLLLIARTPQGDFIGIKVPDDRPEKFNTEMERIQWNGATVRNLLRLKTDIEQGSISPKRPNVILNPQLTTEERILAIEKCVVDRKQERLHWLQLESKLVEYDSEIKTYLGLEKADTDKALHCLEQISTLPIEQLMLTKHPHVVEMVRRLRRYIGNVKAWNLTPEQHSEFMKGAEQIRQKADEVYQKFKALYGLSPQDSFTEVYNSYVKEFNLKTKHMKEAQRFAVCAKPGTRQFEMDQMDDQLELEAIKLKNELENKKTRNQNVQDADMGGSTTNT